ncbi:hypothetical protein M271_18660 [Streptomyces rapamycinicus NRRL 5491]|nr:hypothetical protein M271_18660 [Streptomyces rapamycinicus NRRL 5491]
MGALLTELRALLDLGFRDTAAVFEPIAGASSTRYPDLHIACG